LDVLEGTTLGCGDCGDGQLNVVLLIVQRSLSLGLHGDDSGGSSYLELEVGVAGDGHELDVTWPPQDDVVRTREINHLKSKHFGVVVACVSEGDRQSNLPEGDGLLVRDHCIEWMWATFELVLGNPWYFECVKVHEVEATAPTHEGFGELGHPD
jgi:hypothetical protein